MKRDMNLLPYRRELGGGLVLKTLSRDEDIERIVALHRDAFPDPGDTPFARDLLTKRPYIRQDDFIFVEDEKAREIVSSVCLVPAEWAYGDVVLRVAELGLAGTKKGYRRRGLIREQMKLFHEKVRAQGFDLAVIQGIPYFYRQFGYEYALPLGGGYVLRLDQISDVMQDEDSVTTIREMTDGDIPQAMAFCEASTARLCLRSRRDEALWRYQENRTPGSSKSWNSFIVEVEGRPVGYFRSGHHWEHKDTLFCLEMSDLGYEQILCVLRHLKKEAQASDCAKIVLSLPPSSPAMETARYLGATEEPPYAWQIRIPNRAQFFRRIAPELERRLAASPMAGMTRTLRFNFYEEMIEITFQKGRIAQVESLGPTDDREICIPPLPAVQLLLCYRDLKSLQEYRPDTVVRRGSQQIVDILFPKLESYIYNCL